MAKRNILDIQYENDARKKRFCDFLARGVIDENDIGIAKPDFRYTIGGVECVPSGDIIAVAGKPGVGKSTALAILIGVLCGNRSFGEIACKNPCNRVLWIDTEKGAYSCIQRIKVLKSVAGFSKEDSVKDHGIDFFQMRDVMTDDRLFFIDQLAQQQEYDSIVIDGIFDLTTDPDNDYMPVIDLLKRLATKKTSVFAMLHTNKQDNDNNMRYALGTELQRICTTRFTIKFDKAKQCHEIIHDKSNDTAIAPNVCFKYDENGVVVPIINGKKVNPMTASVNNDFESILRDNDGITYIELVKNLIKVAGIKNRAAKTRIQNALNKVIYKDDEGKYHLINTMQCNGAK